MAKDRYPRTFHTENPQALQTELGQLVDALRARDRQGPLDAPRHEWDQLQPVAGTWGVEPSITEPAVGSLWRWDGTLWSPSSAGIGAIEPLAATANTVGLWPLNGVLDNTVDAANPATVAAGTEIYTDVVPGKRAFFFNGTTRLQVAAFVPALALTGDHAGFAIYQLDTDPTASTILFGHGGPGDASSTTNILYSATVVNATPPRLMNFLSESGVGVNASYTTAAPDSVPPIHNIGLFAYSKIGGIVQFYMNGLPFGAPSGVLTTPFDGSAGRFQIGASDTTTTMTRAVCWGVRIDNVGRTAAEHKAVYNATLGQGFGLLA